MAKFFIEETKVYLVTWRFSVTAADKHDALFRYREKPNEAEMVGSPQIGEAALVLPTTGIKVMEG